MQRRIKLSDLLCRKPTGVLLVLGRMGCFEAASDTWRTDSRQNHWWLSELIWVLCWAMGQRAVLFQPAQTGFDSCQGRQSSTIGQLAHLNPPAAVLHFLMYINKSARTSTLKSMERPELLLSTWGWLCDVQITDNITACFCRQQIRNLSPQK